VHVSSSPKSLRRIARSYSPSPRPPIAQTPSAAPYVQPFSFYLVELLVLDASLYELPLQAEREVLHEMIALAQARRPIHLLPSHLTEMEPLTEMERLPIVFLPLPMLSTSATLNPQQPAPHARQGSALRRLPIDVVACLTSPRWMQPEA